MEVRPWPAWPERDNIMTAASGPIDQFVKNNHPIDMTLPILITGASRGLGAGMALALANTAPIIAVGKTVGALEDLDDRIKEKGGTTTLAPMDITRADAMAQLCRGIHDRWGGLQMWVHTAVHAAPLSPAGQTGEKDFVKSVEVNVTAFQRLISFVAPLLGNDSQVLFFDDRKAGEKFFGSYGATKAAQIALAKSWQAEAAKTGPKVHIATPNPMPTATRARFYPGEDREGLADPQAEALRILSALGIL